jgi:hypothetical protein
MGDVLTRKCRHGVLINEGFPFDDVPQHHTTPDTTVWIDLCRRPRAPRPGRQKQPTGRTARTYLWKTCTSGIPRGGSPCWRSSNSDPTYGGGDRGCPS